MSDFLPQDQVEIVSGRYRTCHGLVLEAAHEGTYPVDVAVPTSLGFQLKKLYFTATQMRLLERKGAGHAS